MEDNYKDIIDYLKTIKYQDDINKKILIDPDKKENLNKIIDCLKEGGVIIFYSEATYGLATNALEQKSIERLRKIKGRDLNKALSVLSNKHQIEEWVTFNNGFRDLYLNTIRKYWPGYISFILRKRKDVSGGYLIPDFVTSDKDTVCLMCMDYVSEYLSLNAVFPIAATSANSSGEPSLIDPIECIKQFGKEVDLLLIGPPSKIGINTTIIDLVSVPPKILREGPVKINIEEFMQ